MALEATEEQSGEPKNGQGSEVPGSAEEIIQLADRIQELALILAAEAKFGVPHDMVRVRMNAIRGLVRKILLVSKEAHGLPKQGGHLTIKGEVHKPKARQR